MELQAIKLIILDLYKEIGGALEKVLFGRDGAYQILAEGENALEQYIIDTSVNDTLAYNIGKVIGDIASVAVGIIEVGGGLSMMYTGINSAAGGVLLASTGAGIEAGIGLIIEGGAVAVGGAAVIGIGSVTAVSGMITLFGDAKDVYDSASGGAGEGKPDGDIYSKIDDIINKIPNKYKVNGQCDAFAKKLAEQLKKQGIDYEIVRIDSEYGIYSDKAGEVIGDGYHYGIKVDDIIYDNMTSNGMSFGEWLDDLGLTSQPNSIINWSITDDILHY